MDASPLSGLCAERRNNIYRFALARDEVDIAESQPGLTRTCSQIRRESLQLSYAAPAAFALTVDRGDIDDAVEIWLEVLAGSGCLRHIRAIRIHTVVRYDGTGHRIGWMRVLDSLVEFGFGGRVEFVLPDVEIPPLRVLALGPTNPFAVALRAISDEERLGYMRRALTLVVSLREMVE
ncbi:hypothetical protein LTR53_012881 [Teratosphaeriaceae sp. CCFEE 6253]|nr:hypothetical protein LTR53_012881 [Teratosphaeriaceae sp. CCFEE 6253]